MDQLVHHFARVDLRVFQNLSHRVDRTGRNARLVIR